MKPKRNEGCRGREKVGVRNTGAENGVCRFEREREKRLLPRPAALAGGAVGGRDRDRAGDQEERELLECARRTRVSSTGTPGGGVNQRTPRGLK